MGQEQGEKKKKKEPLPRLCHRDGDDDDLSCHEAEADSVRCHRDGDDYDPAVGVP